MIINEIKRIKRGHYAVVFDTTTAYATESMLADYHLYKGKQLDADWSFEAFADEYDKRCCYQRALQIVARRDHFINELTDKLKQRGFKQSAIADTIEKLLQLGYLNEQKYAALLVAHYQTLDSSRQLRSRLLKKGCPRPIIDQLLSEAPLDELDNAIRQLDKKINSMSPQQIIEKRDKLMYYLVRRGFDYGVAKRSFQIVVDKLNSSNPN